MNDFVFDRDKSRRGEVLDRRSSKAEVYVVWDDGKEEGWITASNVIPEPEALPWWFLKYSPLSMDPLKGPDEQYRAGARDMLNLLRVHPDWLNHDE